MAKFQLDTSGAVERPAGYTGWGVDRALTWEDLSPFVQGYVEALFASANRFECKAECLAPCSDCLDEAGPQVGFSDLAPETLALILKDCERFEALYGEWPLVEHGRGFWSGRQRDKHSPEFPPLTPALADDGKVYLR